MGRPLTQVLAFFALSSVVLFLAMDTPLPGEDELNNTTLSDDQTTLEANPTNQTAGVGAIDCIPLFHFFTGEGFVCDELESLWDNTVGQTAIGKAITTVTKGLGDFVRLLGRILTFDIPEAPYWIRFPFSFVLIGTSSYIVVSLVRGAG